MPELRNVDVSVVIGCNDGEKAREFGTKTLRGGKHVMTYIPSVSLQHFQVVVHTKIPYVAHDAPGAASNAKHNASLASKAGANSGSAYDYELPHPLFPYHGEKPRKEEDHPDRLYRLTKSLLRCAPWRTPQRYTPVELKDPPNFDFVVKVYLDGRKRAETSRVAYLNPQSSGFQRHGPVCILKGRHEVGRDGRPVHLDWMFKDVGVETVLDRMTLEDDPSPEAVNADDDPADALVRAMSSVDVDDKEAHDRRAEKCGLGKIVVTLTRAQLRGRKVVAAAGRVERRVDAREGVKDADESVVHKVSFSAPHPADPRETRSTYSWALLKEEEDVYATYTFFYRSEEQLQKFNFPDFPAAESPWGASRDPAATRPVMSHGLRIPWSLEHLLPSVATTTAPSSSERRAPGSQDEEPTAMTTAAADVENGWSSDSWDSGSPDNEARPAHRSTSPLPNIYTFDWNEYLNNPPTWGGEPFDPDATGSLRKRVREAEAIAAAAAAAEEREEEEGESPKRKKKRSSSSPINSSDAEMEIEDSPGNSNNNWGGTLAQRVARERRRRSMNVSPGRSIMKKAGSVSPESKMKKKARFADDV